MDSFVRSSMALGRLLIILTTSVVLTACGTTGQNYNNSVSTYASTNEHYNNVNGSAILAINYFKWSTNRMNAYDRKQQEKAVYFALNNLQNGEVTNWYNGNTNARGRVRVAMSYPKGSGYCRVLHSEIHYNGKTRNFQETACINAVDNSWRFFR